MARPFRGEVARLGAVVAVAALAALAQRRVLGYWFTGVDALPLIVSSRVRSVGDAVDLVTEPLMHGTAFAENALFFRPVASLTYAVDYAIWGADPVGYHLTDLLLHAGATAVVAVLVWEVADRDLASAALAGLVFGLHPLTVEVIPSPARRHDVLATGFVVLAVLLFVRGWRANSRRTILASAGALLLALGSKETAIVLGPLLAAWFVLEEYRPGVRLGGLVRRGAPAALPFVVVTVGYLAWRVAVLGGVGGYVGRAPRDAPVARLIQRYARSLLHPTDQLALLTGVELPVVPHLLVLVGGGLAALAAVAVHRAGGPAAILDSTRARGIAFFAVWLVVPLALHVATGRYAVRVGYLSLPAVAGLTALLLVPAARRLREWMGESRTAAGRLGPEVGALAVGGLLTLSLAAGSPLIVSYDGWAHASDVSRQSVTAVAEEAEGLPADASIVVAGLPHVRSAKIVTDAPRAVSVTYFWSHTVAAWTRLQGSPGDRTYRPGEMTMIRHRHVTVRAALAGTGAEVPIQLRYLPRDGRDEPAGARRTAPGPAARRG